MSATTTWVKPEPETVFPNPLSERLHDLEWTLRYSPNRLEANDRMLAASAIAAYRALVEMGVHRRRAVINALRGAP